MVTAAPASPASATSTVAHSNLAIASKTMTLKIYISGKFYDKEDAKISVYDHGLLYGDGVFEAWLFVRDLAAKVSRLALVPSDLAAPIDPSTLLVRGELAGEALFNFAPTSGDIDGDGDRDIAIGRIMFRCDDP